MPKPYIVRKPSGLYVRFLVPHDLRAPLGRRFIVRPVTHTHPDLARQSVASLAVALSQAFGAMREHGDMVDFKALLESALEAWKQARGYGWTADSFTFGPKGVEFKNVKTEDAQDRADFLAMVKELAGSTTQAPAADLLSVAIDKHLESLKKARRATDTVTESTHTLRIFLGVTGDKPVDQLNPDDIRLFLDAVRWWPSNASKNKKFDGLSVPEIVERGKELDVPMPSPHTENKHMSRLKVLLKELEETGQIKEATKKHLFALLKERKTTTADTGRPFTDDELTKIFGPMFMPWAKKYPHRYFGPLIALFTGARVTEVAQLYVDDIQQVEGVWGIHIAKRFFGQKIKNDISKRFVPIHPKLVETGLLEYRDLMKKKNVHDRLFPHLPVGTNADGKENGLGYGRQLSRQFSTHCESVGIEKGIAFHAFRHTFSTKLDRAGKSELEISRLTGHMVEGTVLSKHYIQERTLPERVKTLGALSFDFLDTPKWTEETRRALEATLRDKKRFHR